MASSGRQSNGRSPLVNQQRQITSFFSKQTTKIISGVKPRADCSSDSNRSPTPTPTTPSPLQSKLKKPLLVVGVPPASSCSPPTQKSVGSDVVGRRVRVYWPLDKSWYEGCVKLFDEHAGKHLVQYDDGEEEMLELNKEKIEWVEQSVKRFKRLRRGSFGSLGLKSPVMKDDLAVVEDDLVEKVDDGMENDAADDSSDEDWLDIGDNKAVEEENMESLDDDHEEEDDVMERSKRKQKGKNNSRKRKGNGGQVKSAKKNKTGGADADQSAFVVSSMEHKSNTASDNTFNGINHATGDTTERFSLRDAEKLWFLDKDRRDARQRRSGDVDFDPRTLYLPPDFLKSLSGGQRQWWEFKSKHMDKVLFFKMGKFYELFEMDAHIAAKELDLHYMKGEQPHCGFPEKNFSMNLEKLVQKGYRVLVVEQTETPEQLELRRKEKGSTDKVVRREICAVVTKGTLTEGDFLSANYDASFIMAITENCQSLASPNSNRAFGVCMVDVTTSRVILGQFVDDSECNALCRILSELKPVEIVKPAKLLSLETEKILLNHTRSPLVNELLPHIEFWDAEKTVQEVKNIYGRIIDHSISGSLTQESFPVINSPSSLDELNCLPDVLSKLLSMGEGGCWALSALGGALFYLKQCFLDETLLKFAHFELLPCSDFSDVISKPYMVLDAAALENLEVFYNCQNGDSAGTLYAQLNHCVTAPGKRLLKTWLARPLYNLESIKERQNVVAILRGDNLSFALEFRKTLSKVPDVERLLARVFSYSEGNGRNAKKVVLYEDAARKQLQEFICALRGCESMFQACFSLSTILNNVESKTLHHLLTPGERLPDLHSVISHFKDSFDWVEANNSGRIIPHESIDLEYDSACEKIKETESSLAKYLKEQRKILGGASISYVTIGKEAYLLEVPESLRGSIAKDYELRSSRKGYFRYWTPKIKKLLSDLSQAESEKESSLKTILQRLIGKFCEHHMKWRELVSVTAEIDVLISLAISRDYYEGPTCQPTFLKSASPDEVPCFFAKTLGHPVLRTDSLGRGTFVSNDVRVGGSEFSNFILLTGPNMGGKSTLLRQVCLSVILAQVGADVPAERFDLSPVDRIFVRMGAKDHIMAGQSTFLTELSETAAMLASATRNSLVALDELGRGTSTSDGQAIAASVLEHFVSKVQCRGMFSTHYHQLAIDYQNDPRVALCHMACHVGRGIDGVEEVTFLYRLTPGACPKSYGVNVARLAGLPNSVLEKAADKSREFEATHGKLRKVAGQNSSDQTRVDEVVAITRELIEFSYNSPWNEPKDGGTSSLTKLQNRTRRLLQNPYSTGVASGVNSLQPFFQTNDVALPI